MHLLEAVAGLRIVYNSYATRILAGLRSAYNATMFVSKQATLAMLAGLPGTGKTTLAYALAQQLGWSVLDKDLLNGVLLNAGMEQGQAAPLACQLLFTLAEDLVVQQRSSVILDSAGRQPFILERVTDITPRGGAQLKVIRCVAPQAVRTQRLASRVAGPSQWTVDQATDANQEAWYAHLPPDTLVLSTTQSVEKSIATALTLLVARMIVRAR